MLIIVKASVTSSYGILDKKFRDGQVMVADIFARGLLLLLCLLGQHFFRLSACCCCGTVVLSSNKRIRYFPNLQYDEDTKQ